MMLLLDWTVVLLLMGGWADEEERVPIGPKLDIWNAEELVLPAEERPPLEDDFGVSLLLTTKLGAVCISWAHPPGNVSSKHFAIARLASLSLKSIETVRASISILSLSHSITSPLPQAQKAPATIAADRPKTSFCFISKPLYGKINNSTAKW
jgi:hypothetical protein